MKLWIPAFGGMTILGLFLPNNAHAARRPAYNEIAADFPIDGGGLLMMSRLWQVSPRIDLGITAGGGVIQRDFEINDSVTGAKYDAHTRAGVIPFVGPRIGFNTPIIGLSVAFGVFHASTRFEADVPGSPQSVSKSAWGTAFYSPLLLLDFYSKKHDLFVGLGLGGFLGTSYPDLTIDNSSAHLSSKGNPIDTLTIQLRTRWFDGRAKRLKHRDEIDDEF